MRLKLSLVAKHQSFISARMMRDVWLFLWLGHHCPHLFLQTVQGCPSVPSPDKWAGLGRSGPHSRYLFSSSETVVILISVLRKSSNFEHKMSAPFPKTPCLKVCTQVLLLRDITPVSNSHNLGRNILIYLHV